MDSFALSPGAIAYEDDYLLIIDKPPGMLIHPTVNESGCTLYDYVAAYYQQKNLSCGIHRFPVLTAIPQVLSSLPKNQ